MVDVKYEIIMVMIVVDMEKYGVGVVKFVEFMVFGIVYIFKGFLEVYEEGCDEKCGDVDVVEN